MSFRVEAVLREGDAAWEFYEDAVAQGLTEGLPIAPVTPARLHQALDYLGRDPAEVLGHVPPSEGPARVEDVIALALAAGCLPEHTPVVLAAVEGVLGPAFRLAALQRTTGGFVPLIIVSGDAVQELGFNSGHGVFAAGARASGAVGRALRLVLRNIGGEIPGATDLSTLGGPQKLWSCIAEDETTNPWEPLHAARGLCEATSAVTVVAAGPHNCQQLMGARDTPWRGLAVMADGLRTPGNLNVQRQGGEAVVCLSPPICEVLQRERWSRSDVQAFLYEKTRWRLGDLRDWGLLSKDAAPQRRWIDPRDEDALVPVFDSPESILVVPCGGRTMWWAACCHGPGPYGGHAITCPVRFPAVKAR